MACRPLGSSVHGISQERILEWAAISFSRASSQPRDQTRVSCIAGRFFTSGPPGKAKYHIVKVKLLSRVQLCMTPGQEAHQAPPSLGFSRQEPWSGLPFPSPEDLPDPGIKPRSPAMQADSLLTEL